MHLPSKQIIIAVAIAVIILLFFVTRTKRSNFEDLPTTDTTAAGTAFRTYQAAAKTVYDYFETYRLVPSGVAIEGYSARTGQCDATNTACVAITTLRSDDLAKVIAWYVATRAPGLYDSSPINCPRDPTAPADAPSVLGLRVTMPATPLTASGTASATNKGYTLNFTPPAAPGVCPAGTTAAQAYIVYTGV
jgi:cell division septation protein DedD